MRAVVLSGPNQFAPADIPKPEIDSHEILLEMKAAAICGTDMRILTGKKTKGVRYPSVIGHEFCGIIAQVGADVKGYSVGEKVAVANVIPCHHCSSCLRGRTNACLDRKAIGYEFDGGFEEYIRIPAICIENGNVVKLPDHVSFAAGALIEPLSCCIRGLRNAGTGFNDDVLIVGAGPIGLFHLQLAKIAGARKVIVSEPSVRRLVKSFISAVPALMVPVILLTGMYSGIYTPTEGAGIAVAYAVLVSIYVYKRLKWSDIPRIICKNARQTGTILFIAITAKPAGQIFELDGLPTKLANFILGISDNQLVIMFALFAFLIIVGMFMDATAAIYILVPILLPVVKQLGVQPLFFVVFLVIALSFGLITPPVGVCLYAAENVTGIPFETVVKSVIPWLFLTVGILCVLIIFPQIITGPIAILFPNG